LSGKVWCFAVYAAAAAAQIPLPAFAGESLQTGAVSD
jgi:hypothetical protein